MNTLFIQSSDILPHAFMGNPYTNNLLQKNHSTKSLCVLKDGKLPSGVILNPQGQIIGIPVQMGTYVFTISITSKEGRTEYTSYTLKVKEKPINGVSYELLLLDFSRNADYTHHLKEQTGISKHFNMDPRSSEEKLAFRYYGNIYIHKPGMYRFFIESSGGCSLYIENELVVQNENQAFTREESGSVDLKIGLHPIVLLYWQNSRKFDLEVNWEGPDFKKEWIPQNVLYIEGS
jgi:hypothetical protein